MPPAPACSAPLRRDASPEQRASPAPFATVSQSGALVSAGRYPRHSGRSAASCLLQGLRALCYRPRGPVPDLEHSGGPVTFWACVGASPKFPPLRSLLMVDLWPVEEHITMGSWGEGRGRLGAIVSPSGLWYPSDGPLTRGRQDGAAGVQSGLLGHMFLFSFGVKALVSAEGLSYVAAWSRCACHKKSFGMPLVGVWGSASLTMCAHDAW